MTDFDPAAYPILRKGHAFEDFEVGQRFEHHWGRTLNEGDNSLFTTATLAFNPLYFNAEYARANGHPGTVLSPMLVLCTVVGLSVEDLSEAGGPFLGIDDLRFHRPAYPGDTLVASSTVVAKRTSESRQGFGVVTWHSEGRNQRAELIVDYKRSNLVAMRERR